MEPKFSNESGVARMLPSVVFEQRRPSWFNGVELLEDSRRNNQHCYLSTGIEGIDMILGGGLRMGQLIEVVGQSSSGKTQACLRIATNVAHIEAVGVLWIDTGNSFSPQRITHFLARNADSSSDQTGNRIVEKVMRRILCNSVYDIFTMFDVLHRLEIDLNKQMHVGDCKIKLIVVDSISSLITTILGSSGSQGHALMISAAYLLKKIAHDHNVAVLVTNHMVGADGGNVKPALGESWKGIPHVRLLLSREHGTNCSNVLTLKQHSTGSGTAKFVTHEEIA